MDLIILIYCLQQINTKKINSQDFLVDASAEMGSFMLPTGSNERECQTMDEVADNTSSTKRKRSPEGVTAYNHRLHWSEDKRKIRCRLSKV